MLEDKQNEWDWRQINAFAAQNGALLGTYGLLSLVVYAVGLRYSQVSMLGFLLVLSSPFVGAFLCVRFRETITERNAPFSFGKGYVHCLLMGIYAGILIAMGLYMWFAFLIMVYLQMLFCLLLVSLIVNNSYKKCNSKEECQISTSSLVLQHHSNWLMLSASCLLLFGLRQCFL